MASDAVRVGKRPPEVPAKTMSWRLGFAGAPAFAATILRHLLKSSHSVEVVYTQPDRRAGRGRKLSPSAVRTVAEAAGIDVLTPVHLRGAEAALTNLDCLVVAAYGLLLPPAMLKAPKYRCLNVHASLLPRWRGAAPVERAIMSGDDVIGVSIMQIDAGLDTGPVYRRATLPLNDKATSASVTEALAELGAQTLLEVLAELPGIEPEPQDDRAATYAPKLTPQDAVIDWRNGATTIARQIRALAGRGFAHTTVGDLRVRILEAGRPSSAAHGSPPGTLQRHRQGWHVVCRDGALELLTVQLNRGKGRPLTMRDAANGYPRYLFDGARCGVPDD